MRFHEDGPDIPASLIEARDLGQVVFFCGAGVSAPAGLPSFEGLADRIIERLGAGAAKKARIAHESLDRVFTALFKEFGTTEVDARITSALKTPRNVDLRHHQAIIDLSREADDTAKVVTTNFDRLFERADSRLRTYVPPALPDLSLQQPIRGIVYLHGRLNAARDARAGYVISSADFGRAYLAEGWAARFVRDLGERYTIVLLGYSANDPPMRYLLEGLHSREDPTRRSPIYAFAPEGDAAADEAWLDKGVTTIPYALRGNNHSILWETVFSWAESARDPVAWQTKVVGLAQSDPRNLKPFERGQVAHLVGTSVGADAFASATPPPPAEWLCVFDANVRYAKPKVMRLTDDEEQKIDPLQVFGLDSDPVRPDPGPSGAFVPPGDDLLRWRVGDNTTSDRQRLSGFHVDYTNLLTGRLYHLARWIAAVMEQPAAIWWGAVNTLPHPVLRRELENRMDKPAEHAPARIFWRSYLDAARANADDHHGFRLYSLADRVQVDGWSKEVLRELERDLVPTFEIGRALGAGPVPPIGDWDTIRIRDLAEIKIASPKLPEDRLDPPSHLLAAVIALMRRSLERTAEMVISESTDLYYRVPTLHPSGDPGEYLTHDRQEGIFLKFAALFKRLSEEVPALARQEIATWSVNGPFFFAKLFLYVAWLPDLLPPGDFDRRLRELSDAAFWDDSNSREMLFALSAQWPGLSPAQRRRVERRIVTGPPSYEGESRNSHRRRKSARAATWLEWLKRQGAQLSTAADARLPQLKAAHPRWNDVWTDQAAESDGPVGGVVERVTEPQGLDAAPIPELVRLATALTKDDLRQLRDYRPFDGVVKAAPLRALSALRLSAKRPEYPSQYWRSLVDNWPEGSGPRLNLLLAMTLAKLPDNLFRDLRHGIARWARSTIPAIAQQNRKAALQAFDAILRRYETADPATLESAVGFSTVGGIPQTHSQVSFMKAINSPGGQLTQSVLSMLGERKRPVTMPKWADGMLRRLLLLPGNGAGHAACVVAHEFEWLRYWFKGWPDVLLPDFEPDHLLSEALWHGVAAAGRWIGDPLGRRIKRPLLAVLSGNSAWELDKDERKGLVQQMVNLTYARDGKPAVVRFSEARTVLMVIGDDDRANALMILANSMRGEGMWKKLVRPFLLHAWPRQLRYQTAETARQLSHVAERAEDLFPEVVETILPLVRPVAHLDTFTYRLNKVKDGATPYGVRFPSETLRLLDALVGDDPTSVPWNFAALLDELADAAPELRQTDPWRRLRLLA